MAKELQPQPPLPPDILTEMRYVWKVPEPDDLEKSSEQPVSQSIAYFRKMLAEKPDSFIDRMAQLERQYQQTLAAFHRQPKPKEAAPKRARGARPTEELGDEALLDLIGQALAARQSA